MTVDNQAPSADRIAAYILAASLCAVAYSLWMLDIAITVLDASEMTYTTTRQHIYHLTRSTSCTDQL